MKKSGLQKQIASIFNDVPAPGTDPTSMPLPSQPQQVAIESTSVSTPPVLTQDVAETSVQPQQPSLVQRMAQVQAGSVHTPASPAIRPRPLVKTNIVSKKPKATQDVTGRIKKILAGSNNAKMDPRQKKMTIMVGALSVVFAVVLFVSLGGLGQSSATAAGNQSAEEASSGIVTGQKPLQWQSPQSLPEQLRNPMAPAAKKVSAEKNIVGSDQLVVKGIVYSKTRPTAIINDQIMAQGESLNGVKIVTIGKETVEFEKNGQRWTQPVQR